MVTMYQSVHFVNWAKRQHWANRRLMSHVVMEGVTTLGEGGTVFHHAVIGAAPQNSKHKVGRQNWLSARIV